jgi:hypothetical protein
MRDASEIQQKLKQAKYRHVKRILRQRFPSNGEWPPDEVAQIKQEYRELWQKAPLHEIARDFPDVAALMWVMGDQRPDEPLAPNGSMVGAMGGVLLWADTDEDAHYARELIERVMNQALTQTTHPDPVKKSWWERIFG